MRIKFLNNPIEVSKQIWEKESIPVVSVRVNTYNHYNYLEECLQGILKQKTTFKIEILIYDDASTDNSKAIFSKYKLKYPDLFKIYISPENLYFTPYFEQRIHNFFSTTKAEFIASVEGDDYWIDEYKLQEQIVFLINNPNYALTFHKVKYLNNLKEESNYFQYPQKSTLSNVEIILNHSIPTCSRVYRKSLEPNPWPEWFNKVNAKDIPQNILLTSKFNAKFFKKKMAVYRNHPSSLTKDKHHIKESYMQSIFIYLNLIRYLSLKSKIAIFYKIIYSFLALLKNIPFIYFS